MTTDDGATGRPVEIAQVNGGDLAFQAFGPDDAPTVVLVAGASSAMDWWDDALCELIAAGDASGPRRVIRYDLRDTGQSRTVPAGTAGYTGSDLLDDLAGLIEISGGGPAHVVGLSLGGGLAQQLALRRPELVASLVLVSTSPGGPGSGAAGELPPPTPELAASFAVEQPEPDWSDPDAVGAYFVETERLFSGSIPVDEGRIRAIARTIVARSIDPAAASNHWTLAEGVGVRRDIESIRAATLVLHGTDDPLFPFAHGEALAAAIPGARLVALEGMGHQNPPPPVWDRFAAEVLRHTSRGADAAG